MDPKVVENLIKKMNGRYGVEAPLVVNRGKVHDYLGMTLDYSVEGKVKILMKKYIEEMLEELPDDMNGKTATPAANHLFTVSEQPVLLKEETV
jgi:hypothetical protein